MYLFKKTNGEKSMKTVKQIADKLGVSKQAIHQKRKKEPLSTALQPFTKIVDGVVYISFRGETLIKQAFSKTEPSMPIAGDDENQFPHVGSQVFGEFSVVIEVLQKQLEVKDKQISDQQQNINELTAALASATSSLKAAQALHAGTIQQHFESLPQEQQAEPINRPKQKKGFFSRFFSGK
jgi:hypothetical protein